MKALLLVFIITLFTTTSMAQLRYHDGLHDKAVAAEADLVARILKEYKNHNTPMKKLVFISALFANRGQKINATEAPRALFLIDPCSDFTLLPSRSKTQCQEKFNYLKSVSFAAFLLTNSETNVEIPMGVKLQILEKYATINNQIEFEYNQMLKEQNNRQWLTKFFKP